MQSVLYALANKFLDDRDLNEVKEVLAMTRLGEMLRNDGIEKGIEKGIEAMVTSFKELGIPYDDALEKLPKSSPSLWSRPENTWKNTGNDGEKFSC